MSRKRDSPNFKAICQAAHKRVVAVLRCLAVFVPDATPRQRKRLANKILTLAEFLLLFADRGAASDRAWLPVATYSPLALVWAWRRLHG